MSEKFVPDQAWWSLLGSVDTPTVCNAIEVAQGRRGFDNFTHRTMLCADESMPAVCGYARTARIRAQSPPQETPLMVKKRRMDYYRYMSQGQRPAVVVIEDVDWPDCIGAYWGEINTTIHSGFGLTGVVTNGLMRDLGDLQPEFQVIAHSIGPSHGFVHVLDFDQPVSFFGLKVDPGDIVHADRHGAVVIPEQVLPVMAVSIEKLLQSEKLILGPAREKGFDFEKFEQAWDDFEKSRI